MINLTKKLPTNTYLFNAMGKDKFYNDIKNNRLPWSPYAKEYWQRLYNLHHIRLDNNFSTELANDSFSRLWELTGVDFLDAHINRGLNIINLTPTTSIPDFCFDLQGNRFYKEMICIGAGNSPELNFLIEEVSGKARRTPQVEYKERLCAAIHEKGHSKYYGIKTCGYKCTMEHDSGLLIAISLAKIAFHNQPRNIYVDLSCLFGISPMKIPLNPVQNHYAMGSPFHDYQSGFMKKSNIKSGQQGAIIKNDYFASDKYKHISAILLSHTGLSFYPDIDKHVDNCHWGKQRNDFILIHNPFAKTSLPKGFFNVTNEITAIIDKNGDIKINF